MLWNSFRLSPASAWVPQWVLAITLILLLLQLAREWLASRSAAAKPRMLAANNHHGRAVAAAAWLCLLLLLTWLLGTALGGAVFCYAWLHWHAGERWVISVIIAAIPGMVLWLVFSVLLHVGLYAGVLLPYLS